MLMKICLEQFCVLSIMYLMNCCHRTLTNSTTPVNDVMIERCLRRKDASLLKTVVRLLYKRIIIGFHSLLLITILFHFTSFYIVPVAFWQRSSHWMRLLDWRIIFVDLTTSPTRGLSSLAARARASSVQDLHTDVQSLTRTRATIPWSAQPHYRPAWPSISSFYRLQPYGGAVG